MTKESIHLIKGYLGYEVPCIVKNTYEQDGIKEFESDLDGLFLDSILYELDFKLMLRPIEDLTNEEIKGLWYEMPVYIDNMSYKKEVTLQHLYDNIQSLDYRTMEYLNKLHIDYFGLIGQGLAVKKEK
jgi:hypothetical protein